MRLLVDGMNVIGSLPDGWWKDRHAAMARLVEELERLAEASGDEITVATSDRRLAGRAKAIGATVLPAGKLRRRIDEAASSPTRR